MRTTILQTTKKKYTKWYKNRLGISEERISEFRDTAMETTKGTKTEKKKRQKKWTQHNDFKERVKKNT